MTSPNEPSSGRTESPADETDTDDYRALASRAERLAQENRRLRSDYARTRQTVFRRGGIALGALGLVAALAAIAFEANRDLLFALAGTGLFGAVLVYILAPGQFITAKTGERIYAPLAANLAAIAAQLDLRGDHRYVPTGNSTSPVRLTIALEDSSTRPPIRSGPIVVEEDYRGLVLEPTGATLFREFEKGLPTGLGTTPAEFAPQLADGLVEQFELTTAADPEVDADETRLTVGVNEYDFGDITRFDHPIPSFLACGTAVAVDSPVSVEISPGSSRHDWLVTCQWVET